MKKTAVWIICFLVITVSGHASGINEIWSRLHSRLDSALSLMEKERNAPYKSWIPFKEDKKSIQAKMDAIMAEAVEILQVSGLMETREAITRCRKNILDFQALISRLQTERLMAPESVAAWKIWEKDSADYDKKIETCKQKIEENREKIEELRSDLQKKIGETGLHLAPEQVDTLIYSVTGEDDVEMIAVFENIKIITARLKDLTTESKENIETARRYYGMHAVLLKILLFLQETYVDRVENKYLPELDRLEKENRTLIEKTGNLLKNSEKQHKSMYKSNLAAQKLTEKTIEIYRRYLDGTRDRILYSHKKIRKEFEVAENTYHTVSTAHALISIFQNSDRFFRSLNQLRIPELLRFDNQAMKIEFEKITARLSPEE